MFSWFILITYMDLSEGPDIKWTSEEELDSYNGFEKNPSLVFKNFNLNYKLMFLIVKEVKMCQRKLPFNLPPESIDHDSMFNFNTIYLFIEYRMFLESKSNR